VSIGSSLTLEIRELVKQRIALRRTYGTASLDQTGREDQEHARKWFLFQGLSEALQDVFAEDVEDSLIAARADARNARACGAA
jgi:hypothetical protein